MAKSNNEIKIGKAKGRPMLTWVGKKPLVKATAYPAQKVESFKIEDAPKAALADVDWSDWPEKFDQGGLLFHGDNKDVLAHLLANGFRGKVKLIYIDPPFDSGADYVRKVQLRGSGGTTKIEGEDYTLGEQIQYTDIWANDNYLQFMYERLLLMKELLANDGALMLHCDDKKSHHLRCLLDEVFGSENFKNEIIWHFPGRAMHLEKQLNRKHNTVFLYAKTDQFVLNDASEKWTKEEFIRVKKQAVYVDDDGREFIWQDRSGGDSKAYKRYLDDVLESGKALDDVWKISIETSSDKRRTDYPTQKPEALIEKIIKATSKEGDLVLDSFVGSGTTAAVCQKMNRRWIGCDINKGSIQTTSKRLQEVMREQCSSKANGGQISLVDGGVDAGIPAQLSYAIWRVNDYDLQIQHNEAVELACEHIGITRTRSDSYFDGRLGNRLVKITPFNHPLSPLDLEDINKEIQRRPDEDRDVSVVCLGMELVARAWVEQHNQNLPINRYHIIELRTDSKYGGFIKHEPLIASIDVQCNDDKLVVEVTDVFSPTIMQRLNMEEGLFRAHIDDWRAVVDCIMIDTNYDGEVFNVALSDIPAKKTDLVEGRYELAAPAAGSTVAVKIIDMLGEEVIITHDS